MKNVSKMINDAIKLVAKVGSMSVNASTVPPALQAAIDATLQCCGLNEWCLEYLAMM